MSLLLFFTGSHYVGSFLPTKGIKRPDKFDDICDEDKLKLLLFLMTVTASEILEK